MFMDTFFHKDRCLLCGECFSRCPYLKLDRETSRKEISDLIHRGQSRIVFRQCRSCYACNLFCPENCQPYGLILFSWYKKYQEDQSLPARISYFMPTAYPNFRTELQDHLDKRGKELISTWAANDLEGELLLFPGCNILTGPELLDIDCLKEIKIAGTLDHCCGEMYYRMGLLDVVQNIAARLTDLFQGKKIGTMLFACPACYNMFRNILPREFGAVFDFEKRFLLEYLLDKMEIKTAQKKKVGLHDSCHARILGPEVTGSARDFIKKMGLELEEGTKAENPYLCCGAAAGATRFNPVDIIKTAGRAVGENPGRNSREIAVYCGGCLLTLGTYQTFSPGGPAIRHVLEYFQDARNKDKKRPLALRSRRLILNFLKRSSFQLFSRCTFCLNSRGEREWQGLDRREKN